MKVRCTKIVVIGGPRHGEQLAEHPRLDVGKEYIVLAFSANPDPDDLLRVRLLVLAAPEQNPGWWPSEMFESVSTRVPSNWAVNVAAGGEIEVAPASWLRPGF